MLLETDNPGPRAMPMPHLISDKHKSYRILSWVVVIVIIAEVGCKEGFDLFYNGVMDS